MAPIGLLDSGIGGLSILQEVRRLLPGEDLIYLADQANLPYGPRPMDEVRGFAEGITRYFLSQQAKMVVLACNTASAAALHHLRRNFPGLPFVGMEPAVRPAARDTRSGVIGVIATAATFQGELYASLIDRFARDVQVVKRACPELVTLAERGGPWTDEDRRAVAETLATIQSSGVDQLVLGCTHFAFLKPLIGEAVGSHVTIIDPAPAVARQVQRVLTEKNALSPAEHPGQTIFLTTGPRATFARQITALLGESAPRVGTLKWQGSQLTHNGTGRLTLL